ncbi:MAG: heparan-alpha-glucosaminide N-acetyltransferase domain-containing protein, partial [Deltaproteobacteria bacterium]
MAEARSRKLWLDWQRGLAVLYMLEWHTWDSWRADPAAVGPVHEALAILGGFAAPSFLYMAGMSQLLGDAAQERKGIPVGVRRIGAIRRALWLLGVAYLLRIFWFTAGGAWRVPDGWQGILKVDVLNVIAVSLLVSALFTVGMKPRLHAILAVGATAAVAFLAPVVAGWNHPPSRILDYLYSEWPRGIFYLFPWAAFCFAGSALGRLAMRDAKPFTWIAIGVGLALAGWAGDKLPTFYAHQDFWRTSPCWFAIRLGGV